jgi:hypothetical protein
MVTTATKRPPKKGKRQKGRQTAYTDKPASSPKEKVKSTKAKAPPVKRKPNRSAYTPKLAEELCALITEGGTIESIAKKEGVSPRSIWNWLEKYPEFVRKYMRAREAQGDAYADKVVNIVGRVIDPETPEHLKLDANSARVAIDALKWSAAKRAPKKYSDRIATELTGTLTVEEKPRDKLATARWIADLLLTAEAAKQTKDEQS